MRVGAHPARAVGDRAQDLLDRPPVRAEQLLRPVRAHPLLQHGQVRRVLADLGQRHLVRPPGALHRLAVHLLGAGPALRRAQDDHRRPLGVARLVRGHLLERRVEGAGHLLVVGADQMGAVAVPLHELEQLAGGDAGQDGRVGDLVAVQVQDGQHHAVAAAVGELAGVPACGQRAGLGLAVADDAGHHQVGVVEGGAVRVRERVPQLAALVDGSGRLRCHVTGDAAGEGELAEQPPHALHVLRHVRIPLGVRPLQPRVRHRRGPAVAGARDVDHVLVPFADHPVEVGEAEVQAGRRAPVAEQARLDVLRPQRLGEQRVVQQVDLPDGQIVGRPPIRVYVLHAPAASSTERDESPEAPIRCRTWI